MPFFSIVIPLYNKEKSIINTVQSVLRQTLQDFELIIVNDGSTDNSLKVVQEIADNDSRIHIIDKKNGGVSSARNTGIKAATSEYIALLDGDDYWDSTYIMEQKKLIEEFPNASMWGVNYAFLKGEKCTRYDQGLGDEFRGYVNNYFGTRHGDLFISSSVVIKKEVLVSIGYFDERISSSEDLDAWYRIILKYNIVFFDKVLAYYNQNAENRVAYDTDVRFPLHKDIKYYISKYEEDFKSNPQFAHFLCTQFASGLLKDNYYFGTKEERKESDEVVKHLCYEAIHPKYKWIFKSPRFIGYIIYKIVCLKKAIKE